MHFWKKAYSSSERSSSLDAVKDILSTSFILYQAVGGRARVGLHFVSLQQCIILLYKKYYKNTLGILVISIIGCKCSINCKIYRGISTVSMGNNNKHINTKTTHGTQQSTHSSAIKFHYRKICLCS